MHMKKRVLAILLALVLVLGLAACSGGGNSGDGGSSSGGKKVAITIFNSKMEIQSQMEEMAKKRKKA